MVGSTIFFLGGGLVIVIFYDQSVILCMLYIQLNHSGGSECGSTLFSAMLIIILDSVDRDILKPYKNIM